MTEIKRDAKGRFLKGNKEGARFGSDNGLTTEIDPKAARDKGQETKRRNRIEREVYERLMNAGVPESFDKVHATLEQMGYEPNERNMMVAGAVRMLQIMMGDDKKAAIAAAGHIHKVLSDGKLDITTNGKDIRPEPCVFEIIDRREQVRKREEE